MANISLKILPPLWASEYPSCMVCLLLCLYALCHYMLTLIDLIGQVCGHASEQ